MSEGESVQFDYTILESCTLYQAVRWVAFGENPINYEASKIVYPYFMVDDWDSGDLFENELCGSLYKDGVVAHISRYVEAKQKLYAALISGNIVSKGRLVKVPNEFLSKIYDEVPLVHYGHVEKILPEKWQDNWSEHIIDSKFTDGFKTKFGKHECSVFNIDWMRGTLNFVNTQREVYQDIKLCSKELSELFKYLGNHAHEVLSSKNSKNRTSSGAGRKPQYDWYKKIYPEIAVYIHENGNVTNANKMAEDIYDICLLKYGENETPDIETIRKIAASPICRRFRFGNN